MCCFLAFALARWSVVVLPCSGLRVVRVSARPPRKMWTMICCETVMSRISTTKRYRSVRVLCTSRICSSALQINPYTEFDNKSSVECIDSDDPYALV